MIQYVNYTETTTMAERNPSKESSDEMQRKVHGLLNFQATITHFTSRQYVSTVDEKSINRWSQPNFHEVEPDDLHHYHRQRNNRLHKLNAFATVFLLFACAPSWRQRQLFFLSLLFVFLMEFGVIDKTHNIMEFALLFSRYSSLHINQTLAKSMILLHFFHTLSSETTKMIVFLLVFSQTEYTTTTLTTE